MATSSGTLGAHNRALHAGNEAHIADLAALGDTVSTDLALEFRGKGRSFSKLSGRDLWPNWRRRLAQCLESKHFDMALGLVILSNVLVMVVEVDRNAECNPTESCAGREIEILNIVYTAFYTIECGFRMLVYRERLFHDVWNVLDLLIVMVSWIELSISYIQALEDASRTIPVNINFLRLLRVARLLRATRILEVFPELHLMVTGFARAMAAMFWGFVMILCLLLIWAILAVEIIHPLNKHIAHDDPWCEDAFGEVVTALLIFFQTIVAGDSWGHCTIDVIRKHKPTFFLFAGALISVQLGFMNLILSVIVDSASKARETDKEKKMVEVLKERQKATGILLALLEEIDTDSSGTLSFEELHEGYIQKPALQEIVGRLGLEQEDLRMLFEIMDADRSGAISYHEFIRYIHNVNTDQLQQHLLLARLFKRPNDDHHMIDHKLGEQSASAQSVRSGRSQKSGIGVADILGSISHAIPLQSRNAPRPPRHSMTSSGTDRSRSPAVASQATSDSPTAGKAGFVASKPHTVVSPHHAAPPDHHIFHKESASHRDLMDQIDKQTARFASMLTHISAEFDTLTRNLQGVAAAAALSHSQLSEGFIIHHADREHSVGDNPTSIPTTHLNQQDGPSPGAVLQRQGKHGSSDPSAWPPTTQARGACPRPSGGDAGSIKPETTYQWAEVPHAAPSDIAAPHAARTSDLRAAHGSKDSASTPGTFGETDEGPMFFINI